MTLLLIFQPIRLLLLYWRKQSQRLNNRFKGTVHQFIKTIQQILGYSINRSYLKCRSIQGVFRQAFGTVWLPHYQKPTETQTQFQRSLFIHNCCQKISCKILDINLKVKCPEFGQGVRSQGMVHATLHPYGIRRLFSKHLKYNYSQAFKNIHWESFVFI